MPSKISKDSNELNDVKSTHTLLPDGGINVIVKLVFPSLPAAPPAS